MEQSQLTYYLALHLTTGIGSRKLIALTNYFGSPERAFFSPMSEVMKVPGISKSIAEELLAGRDEALSEAESQLSRLEDDTAIITYFDEQYPGALKATYSAPPLLFVRGNVRLLDKERKIAIVGSRKTSDYGRRAAREFAEAMVSENVIVVSGFASGIDTAAHRACFEAGGKTIAVFGSGVDVIYPNSNKDFAEELIASGRGAIISELPLGSAPLGEHFPPRNRIVAGLASATIIIESELKGGSMITAMLALDENRDVFAVPGDIHRPSSTGPNQLIVESRAKLAASPEQVLIELGWSSKSGAQKQQRQIDRSGLTMFEARIVDVLDEAGGPLQVDVLAERAGLEVQDILVQLLTLEFKSVVRQMAGKQFMLVR